MREVEKRKRNEIKFLSQFIRGRGKVKWSKRGRVHFMGFKVQTLEWIKILWYIYMMEYYTAERKKAPYPLLQHEWVWGALC